MIKNLPSGWQIKPLGELFHIYPGGTPSRAKDEFWHGEIPWVKISDMLQSNITSTDEKISEKGLANSSAKIIPKGSLLISIFATVGRTAFLEIDAATNQAIVGLVPKDKFLSKNFIRYYLDSEVEEIKKQSRGVAQSNINKSILSNIRIPLPPLPIQQQITEILEKADQAIQKRKEANQLTEQFLQSSFIEMFGDPVKNTYRYPVLALDEVCKKLTDGTHNSPKNYEIGKYKYITAKNIKKHGIDLSDITYVGEEDHKNIYARCNPEYGDILFIKDGATTGIAQVNTLKEEFSMLSSLALFKLNKAMINSFYLRDYLNNDFVYKGIRNSMGGAAITRLTIQKLKRIEIIVPPISLQEQYANLVQKTEAVKEKQKQSEHELDNLFNTLMQKAFKGELIT